MDLSPKIVVPLADMQKVETFVPIKASWEEAATGSRGQQGFWFCQTRALGSRLLVVVSMFDRRAIVIPFIGEGRVYNRCSVKVSNTSK
jgi:hypothetical protein